MRGLAEVRRKIPLEAQATRLLSFFFCQCLVAMFVIGLGEPDMISNQLSVFLYGSFQIFDSLPPLVDFDQVFSVLRKGHRILRIQPNRFLIIWGGELQCLRNLTERFNKKEGSRMVGPFL